MTDENKDIEQESDSPRGEQDKQSDAEPQQQPSEEMDVEDEDFKLADECHPSEVDTSTQAIIEQPHPAPQPPADEPSADVTVESVVEAVLFASDEPLTVNRLADIVGTGNKQIKEHIDRLNEKYAASGNAFRIEKIAGGFQMLTLSAYNHWLKKLLRAQEEGKLSPASLETLAIIAYKQPLIRADVEAIRGVSTGEVIRSLMYKGLVKIVGRAEVLGRPMLYGTTKKFLEIFGLNSLKDLPKAEDFKKPQ
jgi:segregation and condensation protein B